MLSKKKIGYWRSNISTPKLIKNWIIQKLLGFNRRVPWPVHWTTIVKSYNKIIEFQNFQDFQIQNFHIFQYF